MSKIKTIIIKPWERAQYPNLKTTNRKDTAMKKEEKLISIFQNYFDDTTIEESYQAEVFYSEKRGYIVLTGYNTKDGEYEIVDVYKTDKEFFDAMKQNYSDAYCDKIGRKRGWCEELRVDELTETEKNELYNQLEIYDNLYLNLLNLTQ